MAVKSPLALLYLGRAMQAARTAPTPRPKAHSRTADKFVIHGYAELNAELDGIGRYWGRSRNSEAQSAVLEALSGWKRSTAMYNVLVGHLGPKVSMQILASIPDFELRECRTPADFVLRFPPNVRQKVKDGIDDAELGATTMNWWFLTTLTRWVNVQRQHYALLSAAMEMNPELSRLAEA